MTVGQPPRMISCQAEVIAGPETAARLGVPVGTVIEVQEARWYRSRLRRTWWELRHRGGPRVRPHFNTEGQVI